MFSTKTQTTIMSPTISSPFASSSAAANATTRALRALHHKHAAKVAAHARVVRLHAKKLLKLQQEIEREAEAIAGCDYKESHDLGYDEYCSMKSQRAVDDGDIRGQGLVDVVELAASIATYAGRVAAEATPPQLPFNLLQVACYDDNKIMMELPTRARAHP